LRMQKLIRRRRAFSTSGTDVGHGLFATAPLEGADLPAAALPTANPARYQPHRRKAAGRIELVSTDLPPKPLVEDHSVN